MTYMNLSEAHGLNPSQIICLFCGETKAIALLGKLEGDAEAPRKVVVDTKPCDSCKEKWKAGFAILSAETDEEGNVQPDGNHVVLKMEPATRMIKQLFPDIDHDDAIKRGGIMLEKVIFDRLFAPAIRSEDTDGEDADGSQDTP